MHIPVLREDLSSRLKIRKGGIVVDCTSGLGGHTEMFSELVGDKGKVIAIEWDEENLSTAKKRLETRNNISWVHDNYKNIYSIINNKGLVGDIDAILFDLGISSPHIDNPERGFSFKKEARLDMRYNRENRLSAYDVINTYTEEDLVRILRKFGEEPSARRIAKKIVLSRQEHIIETTVELTNVIRSAFSKHTLVVDVLQRVFQAIRIEVNEELNNLITGLSGAFQVLAPNGSLAVLSYHSLEDRIVKDFFHSLARSCTCPKESPLCICGNKAHAHLLTKKPITPSKTEIENNRRAKSAKLRILVKN